MIKHTIFAVLAGLVLFASYLIFYVGAFQGVKISDGEAPPFVLLGKAHVGAFHKIVPVIEEVETWAKAHQIDCTQSFGLYRDDPRQTEEGRLQSFGGCWVAAAPTLALPQEFHVETWDQPYFVKAVFEGSPGIGPYKVYPKVEDYISEKGFRKLPGVLEVYVIHSQKEMTTTYYFPVAKPLAAAPAH